MGDNYLTAPLVFLVQVLFGAYTLLVMLRFLLQWLRADFYNPVSQFIVKATTPALKPLRRITPGFRGIDFASILLMILLKAIELSLTLIITGQGFNPLLALAWAIPELVALLINVFLFAIFIQVIISWISPGQYNPATNLLYSLTEPLLKPARRYIPPMGGLDLSPMAVMIILVLIKMLLIPPLQMLFLKPFE
ncbi:MAG: YggT family protein [Gammaproteobacteria bacterium]|nr:YggT family protein [Gammaproteobacteria bacterium]